MMEGHLTHRFRDGCRLGGPVGTELDRPAEVECYHLAAVIAELHWLAIEVDALDLGRWSADREVPERVQVEAGRIPVGFGAPRQELIAGGGGGGGRGREVGGFPDYSLRPRRGLPFQ